MNASKQSHWLKQQLVFSKQDLIVVSIDTTLVSLSTKINTCHVPIEIPVDLCLQRALQSVRQ